MNLFNYLLESLYIPTSIFINGIILIGLIYMGITLSLNSFSHILNKLYVLSIINFKKDFGNIKPMH